ncbi:hypothetical protein BDSB_23350 [Burkholderia dolosa PC543]|nr:hypothetical protein BDSB_23350 [Burkholderia dolosa PC543]
MPERKTAVARLNASEKPATRTSAGMTSVSATTIAPLYMPKKNESHSSTISMRAKLGADDSQDSAGYDVQIASTVMATRIALRPMRSDSAPPIGKLSRSGNVATGTASAMHPCSANILASASQDAYRVAGRNG